MIKTQPFGFPRVFGFGDGRHSRGRYPIEYFYSQSMQHSLFGLSTGYKSSKFKSSDDLVGMGNIQWFADTGGKVFGVDDVGQIYKEATAGAGDFALDHAPGAGYAGQGLIGDQKGRLLYFGATVIGKLDTGVYTDGWKTGLTSYIHPADTYEDMVIFGNKSSVGLLDSGDVLNLTAFTLPSSMTVDCLKAGKHGILIGANLGARGVLMLWNTQTDRAIAPWIWTNGKVQSIERTDSGWIVITQKEVLLTTGYTTRKLFSILDDPFGYSQYTVAAQGTLIVNNKLFILNQASSYGRSKPGISIFDLGTTLFEYVPVSTQNTTSVTPLAIYSSKVSGQEIYVGYRDTFLGKNYIDSLLVTADSNGVFIPEILADSPDEKVAEAVILNVGPSIAVTSVQNITFNVAVKIYNFLRPLWGVNLTNNPSGSANQLLVNGTLTSFTKAQVGDEVTVLEGLNAGQIAHISSIANAGLSNETWTLDTTLPNLTETSVHVSVQPFQLVEKKTVSAASTVPELYFNVKNQTRGKKFLIKVTLDGLTRLQLELHRSEFIYNDLGLTT